MALSYRALHALVQRSQSEFLDPKRDLLPTLLWGAALQTGILLGGAVGPVLLLGRGRVTGLLVIVAGLGAAAMGYRLNKVPPRRVVHEIFFIYPETWLSFIPMATLGLGVTLAMLMGPMFLIAAR